MTSSKYLRSNEIMVFKDINQSITPSAEILRAFGSADLVHLREDFNKLWANGVYIGGVKYDSELDLRVDSVGTSSLPPSILKGRAKQEGKSTTSSLNENQNKRK